MSRVIGDINLSRLGLVVAGGVQGELSDEFAGLAVDDADVLVGGEHGDGDAGMGAADADVVESSSVADGDLADGQPIARAAVSGDGTRAIILDGNSEVSVISMDSGEPIADLGNADAGRVLVPLAINHNGTLAAVAESSGAMTLWHVESAQPLLEMTSDTRRGDGSIDMTAALAYDASRVALLDGDTSTWRIATLDPNDWLAAACENGFTLTDEQRVRNSVDPSIEC